MIVNAKMIHIWLAISGYALVFFNESDISAASEEKNYFVL